MTTTEAHTPWCDDRERGHGDAPCSLYAGSVATDRHLITTTAEQRVGDGSVTLVMVHQAPHLPAVRVELTPQDAGTLSRQLGRLATEFSGKKRHRRRR